MSWKLNFQTQCMILLHLHVYRCCLKCFIWDKKQTNKQTNKTKMYNVRTITSSKKIIPTKIWHFIYKLTHTRTISTMIIYMNNLNLITRNLAIIYPQRPLACSTWSSSKHVIIQTLLLLLFPLKVFAIAYQ